MQIWEELESDPDRGAVALVSTYADRLYRLAYRLCSNSATAEDLAFRTLSRALTSVGRDFGDEKAFFAWLCTILVNFYRQDLRRKGANALVFPETLPEVTESCGDRPSHPVGTDPRTSRNLEFRLSFAKGSIRVFLR